MDLTPAEQPVVRRAVAAYHEAKQGHKGPYKGATADEILEELNPSPVRWAELASCVVEMYATQHPEHGGIRKGKPMKFGSPVAPASP